MRRRAARPCPAGPPHARCAVCQGAAPSRRVCRTPGRSAGIAGRCGPRFRSRHRPAGLGAKEPSAPARPCPPPTRDGRPSLAYRGAGTRRRPGARGPGSSGAPHRGWPTAPAAGPRKRRDDRNRVRPADRPSDPRRRRRRSCRRRSGRLPRPSPALTGPCRPVGPLGPLRLRGGTAVSAACHGAVRPWRPARCAAPDGQRRRSARPGTRHDARPRARCPHPPAAAANLLWLHPWQGGGMQCPVPPAAAARTARHIRPEAADTGRPRGAPCRNAVPPPSAGPGAAGRVRPRRWRRRSARPGLANHRQDRRNCRRGARPPTSRRADRGPRPERQRLRRLSCPVPSGCGGRRASARRRPGCPWGPCRPRSGPAHPWPRPRTRGRSPDSPALRGSGCGARSRRSCARR